MGDLRPLLESVQAAFGLPATVTRPAPDNTPISTEVVWLSPLEEERPFGTDFQRREPRRVLCVARAIVATMPRGTLIVAAEMTGGGLKTWRVDELLRSAEADMWRVGVVQVA